MESSEIATPKSVKIVNVSKYERMKSGSQKWWCNKFKEMETTRKQPYHKRMEYLKECFSKDTLADLLDTGIEVYPDPLEKDILTEDNGLDVKILSKNKLQSELVLHDQPQKYANPYLNFMEKPEVKAQIWRPTRPPSFDELPLTKKAAILEETIATDFDDWWNGIGTIGKSDINKETILDLFQILSTHPVATSLNQNIQQLGAVSASIAQFLGFPECTKTECVSRLIRKDMCELQRKPPQSTAFNKMLPAELRRKPMPENVVAKWFWHEEDDLASMAAVWRGLTELPSIRIYCYWLLKHPEVPRPSFLKKAGLLNKEYLDSVSLDLIEAGINSDLGFDVKMEELNKKKQILQQFIDEMEEFMENISK